MIPSEFVQNAMTVFRKENEHAIKDLIATAGIDPYEVTPESLDNYKKELESEGFKIHTFALQTMEAWHILTLKNEFVGAIQVKINFELGQIQRNTIPYNEEFAPFIDRFMKLVNPLVH